MNITSDENIYTEDIKYIDPVNHLFALLLGGNQITDKNNTLICIFFSQ